MESKVAAGSSGEKIASVEVCARPAWTTCSEDIRVVLCTAWAVGMCD